MRQVTVGDPVAVLGAGTMGAGIAEVAARSGHPVLLFDVRAGAAAEAVSAIRSRLERDAGRGRLSAEAAASTAARLRPVDAFGELNGCALVVEAVVEDLEAKRSALRAVEDAVGEEVMLATNTSALSVTAIGAALRHPQRLVGLHFFNPAVRMDLVEVVRGDATTAKTVDAAADLARTWGKTPVVCATTPGFVVNRIARPFYGEAMRLVEMGAASPATIDAVLREAGGFRMGPFELADLVGHDVNLTVTRSVWERTFHDPRYAPTVGQQRLVDAGRLGRKCGRGTYAYGPDGLPLDAEPATAPPRRPPAEVELVNDDFGVMAAFLDRVEAGGVKVARNSTGNDDDTLDELPGMRLPGDGLLRVTDGSTARSWDLDAPGGVVLLDWAHDPATCTRVALMAPRNVDPQVLDAAIGVCQAAGVAVSVIGDPAGGIVARTVSMLVNEAVDLVARGEASATDVDVAMLLGTGYPSGPLEWGDRVSALRVAAVLGELDEETPTGRYRISPRLDEAVIAEENLRDL
ncbi:MAG TPA: 3-hydroxyacyl-CoA dehydrogenase [Kineosporiaceae bacterium]|nr:3-hydroxyacyl-CoA dehydrogenase [Kineosporiaceae bacterium]